MPDDIDLILPLSPDGLGTPLYCVHAVSGSPYPYAGLGRMIGADQPVYALEAPGFDNPLEPVADVGALADRYVSLLRGRHDTGPVSLLGWSFGGVVAHEMAVRLTAAGADVRVLILVDSFCPVPGPAPDDREAVEWFVHDLLRSSGMTTAQAREAVGKLPGGTDPERLLGSAAARITLLADLGPELLTHRFEVFRSHVHGLRAHRVTPGYRGRVWCVETSESASAAASWQGALDDMEVRTVPGDHHSVWARGQSARLAEVVAGALARAAVR